MYVSDEGRMLASVGDNTFLMGNVNEHTYQELFNSNFVRSLISSSCLECLPGCSDCAYQSFCGSDPVRNYSEQKDVIGNRTMSQVCKKNKEIIRYLFEIIKSDNEDINNIFWSWINRAPLNPKKECA